MRARELEDRDELPPVRPEPHPTYFGARPLNDITIAGVKDFQGYLRTYRSTHARWRGQPLRSASINGYLRVHRLLLRDAQSRRLVTDPIRKKWPAEREEVLRLEASTGERRRFLSAFDDEPVFQRLVAASTRARAKSASGSRHAKTRTYGGGRTSKSGGCVMASFARFHGLRPLFIVAFECGLRRGDLLHLTKSSVHLENGFILVTMQKTRLEAGHRDQPGVPSGAVSGHRLLG